MDFTNLATGLLGSLALWLPQSSAPSTDVEQPGTQPLEVTNLVSPQQCDNCHGGYDVAVEPSHLWRGSMMSHAGRDPLFWSTVAIAEQDFLLGQGGVGDKALRHRQVRRRIIRRTQLDQRGPHQAASIPSSLPARSSA